MRTGAIVAASCLWAASCSRCAGVGPAVDGWTASGAEPAPDVESEPARRLPKHDWNGLTVMMREPEATAALEEVGFRVVPSRLDTFPVLDPESLSVRLVPIQGFSPAIVALETEKKASPLESVYGVRLYFQSNRLYCFQPVYFADPVDLVEPDDTAVPPDVMRERLERTFGTPVHEGSGTIAWADDELVVVYASPEGDGPPDYTLSFFSPGGNKHVSDLVERLLRK